MKKILRSSSNSYGGETSPIASLASHASPAATLSALPRCPHCHAVCFATLTTVPRWLRVAPAMLPCRPRCRAVRGVTPSGLPCRLRCLADCMLRQSCCHAVHADLLCLPHRLLCHAIRSATPTMLLRELRHHISCATK
jgi:hypothetical protein